MGFLVHVYLWEPDMSDVEQYYYKLQAQLGGTTKWEDLSTQQQHTLIAAINIILRTCSL